MTKFKTFGVFGVAVILATSAFEGSAFQTSARASPLIARFMRAGGPVPCTYDSSIAPGDTARCDLKVSITRDSATGICTADVSGRLDVDRGKLDHRIVWTLDTSSATGGYKYEFNKDNGILIVDDKNSQATKGGWGDGNAAISPPRHDQYHVKNKNNKKDSKVFYLPVVVELDASSGDVSSVCVPFDPIIYNGGP